MNHAQAIERENELQAEIWDIKLRLDLLPTVRTPDVDDATWAFTLQLGEALRRCNAELFEVQQLLNAEAGLPYVQV